MARNGRLPTHTSGTIIDLLISLHDRPQKPTTHPEWIAHSDHRLVYVDLPCNIEVNLRSGLGRVSWASPDVWDAALTSITPWLAMLVAANEALLSDPALRPHCSGGTVSVKHRRKLLDAAAWARNATYVVLGHTCGAVRAHRPPRGAPEARATGCRPTWSTQYTAVQTYRHLRKTDPGAAESYLSKHFSVGQAFQVALVDSDTGEPLSTRQMIEALVGDLMHRAHCDFERDADLHLAMLKQLSGIRQSGGKSACTAEASACQGSVPYTNVELDLALARINVAKACLQLPYAAVKANCQVGRSLTLTLMNLSRQFGIISHHWALRQFTPIRKAGPALVKKQANLRPISLCADLAQVSDSLWVGRNVAKLTPFVGPDQVGGISDPLSVVLAVVLLAQLRASQFLPTYLGLLDLRWAFDVADPTGMLHACAEAGVCCSDWLLLDDIFRLDCQCLHLHGMLSQAFVLGTGTPQGRSISMYTFNALLRRLRDFICVKLSGGIRTLFPQYAISAYRQTASSSPTLPMRSLCADPAVVHRMAGHIKRLAAPAPYSQHLALCTTRHHLARLPNENDRLLLMELLGDECMGPLQYVDDTSAACPSIAAVAAITNKDEASACSKYSSFAKAPFNYGPNKMAVMALLGSTHPASSLVGCDVVDTYVLLGCLIDEGLTFVPLLKATCARSMEQFVRLYHAGESGGFSVPVVSAQVPIRIEPGIMYVAPLLFLADRMRYSLDRLQIRWARMLLNCGSGPPLNWALLRLQCGWELRLSTKVLEATFMAFARLQILPSTHPGARMLNVACLSGAETWAVKVRAALSSSELPEPIPELAQCGLFSMEAITQSRTDKEARRQLLRRYRHAVVRPILAQMDVQVLQQTLSCHSTFPPWSLAEFVTGSPRVPMDLLEEDQVPRE